MNRLEVALEHATDQVPVAAAGETAAEVRARLIGQEYESAADVVILDGRRLVGLVPVERLVAMADQQPMNAVLEKPLIVSHATDQEVVAHQLVERGETSGAAVVDADGNFSGLVPMWRMLAVVLAEHDEDLARLGGYMKGSASARLAAEEAVRQRLLHRLPWLLVGLVGAMLSAIVIGAFEEQLDQVLLLAFFLPAVVYLADAVGTQTEAILIRGLSVGIDMHRVVRKELISGGVIGAVIGLCFLPFALIGWGNTEVAVAVALALFCACSLATLVAMLLPLAFHRLGIDPAFGSGPLATVIQDLLSIVVYLLIATAVVS